MSTEKNSEFIFSSQRQEITTMVSIFIKIALQNLFEFLPIIIANMFIGHLSNSGVLMAGCGIARSFTEASASSIAWGLTTPLKTLIPQSIGSNKQYLLQIYVQRAIIISFIALFPLSILQIFSGDIIKLIYGATYCNTDNNNICHIISTYCIYLIPYLFMRCWIAICQRIGQNVNMNTEIAVALSIGSISCIPFNYLFIFYLNYGYIGAAITVDIINLISCLFMVIFLYRKGYGFIFKPISFRKTICSLKGMQEYIVLAIPGIGRAITGFLSIEILVLLSGFIHNPSIAVSASTILYGICIISINVSEALGLMLNIRVGTYIGYGHILFAKRSIKYGAIITIIWIIISSITINILFIVYGDVIIRYLWIDNDEIVYIVIKFMYIQIIRNCIFCWFYPLNGICAGIGIPQYSGYGIFCFQWFIAFPIELILLFLFDYRKYIDFGLFFIWSIPAFSRAILCFILTIILPYTINWELMVTKSKQRLLIDHKSPNYGAI